MRQGHNKSRENDMAALAIFEKGNSGKNGPQGQSARPADIGNVRVERASADKPADALELIDEYYEAVSVVARDSHERLLRLLGDRPSAIWVAYVDSVPAGCILYRPLPHLGSAGEIKRLYVRPRYRGRGLAALLLNALERFAAKQGVTRLYLDTKDDLHDAIAFYERHGYTPCARYNDNPQATIFMCKELSGQVIVRTFQPGDEEAFRILNEAWIGKYFQIEEKDRQTLDDPHTYFLAEGGQIFMALRNGERIGCCALIALEEEGSFEIAKMAVAERERGQGIGRKLIEYAIDYAKVHRIRRLYLETNSSLVNAIHLYESVGFRHLPSDRIQPSAYARANVYMEMILE